MMKRWNHLPFHHRGVGRLERRPFPDPGVSVFATADFTRLVGMIRISAVQVVVTEAAMYGTTGSEYNKRIRIEDIF